MSQERVHEQGITIFLVEQNGSSISIAPNLENDLKAT